MYWSKNRLCHRLYGHAIEFEDSGKAWRKYGNLHRLDGPAIEYRDGNKYWYINGQRYTEEEFKKIINS